MQVHKQSHHVFSKLGWYLAAGSGAGKGRGFLVVWPWVEAINHHFAPATPIPNAPFNLFAVRLTRHKGQTVTLPDGTSIQPGQRIGELHFNNPLLVQVMESEPVWGLLKRLDGDLRALAAWAQTGAMAEIGMYCGVTLLHAIAQRKGFTVRPRPLTFHAHLERFFLEGLLVMYSHEGIRRVTQGTTMQQYPEEVWMTRAELLRRYGSVPAVQQLAR